MSSPAIEFTSGIGAVISRFVALKQGLGFRYETQQYLLARFDRFLAMRAETDLTQESFSAWRSSIEHLTAGVRRMRMQLVRQLCVYRRRRYPACFVPDPTQFPPLPPRRRPHIFSTDEIVRLLDAANALRPWGTSPLYRQVARLAVVLLYTTGLRRGEVVRLSLGDYDSVDRSLLVRDSKFHKSRIIPLSQDAVGEIEDYFRHRRRRGYPLGAASPLLIHRHRSNLTAYTGNGLRNMLRHLFRRAEVLTESGCPPRVHDLRFTFAYHALQRWYRTGVDVQERLPALVTYMGHSSILSTEYYLPVLDVVAEEAGEKFRAALRAIPVHHLRQARCSMIRYAQPTCLARALRRFLGEHMPISRGLSPHTVLSYRDAFALLLRFIAERRSRDVVDLDIGDLTPNVVIAFLEDLETDRGNCAATRNVRLAAIHAFARFAAAQYPEHIETCQRLLGVPFKRARYRIVEYLEQDEVRAMLAATDPTKPHGQRDHALLLVMFSTGARVQETLDITPRDLQLVRPFQLRLFGKGRKERLCPLLPQTAETLRTLLSQTGLDAASTARLFRNRRGEPLTRFGVRYILRKYARLAQSAAPSLAHKRVHPHIMRHSCAVHLLQSGVDMITISHWLGHASVETTNRYAAVNVETKRAALAKAGPVVDNDPAVVVWRSDTSILKWLEAL